MGNPWEKAPGKPEKPKLIICPNCGGKGKNENNEKCGKCGGEGKIRDN